jgi:hypothetical protein
VRSQFEQLLYRTGLLGAARALFRQVSPRHRRSEHDLARRLLAILPIPDASYAEALEALPTHRTALVLGYPDPGLAVLQFPVIAALRASGHRVVVRLYARSPSVEALYRCLGAQLFVFHETIQVLGEHPQTGRLIEEASRDGSFSDLQYRGLSVGKFAFSTLLRQTRLSRVDLADAWQKTAARATLAESLDAADVAMQILKEVNPDLVCFVDRGYTPDGQLFEAALNHGSDAITLNAAHRSGLIMLKRYSADTGNRDRHPASLSEESWSQIQAMPWSKNHWRSLYDELAGCYRSGAWFDEVGTQFDKVTMEPEALRRELGFEPGRKIAVIFAHMFWDATLFYGQDLFDDYEDWFCESLKAAAANDRLDWVIKIHPANLVKDSRDGFQGEHSEIRAIRETLGELPPHIRLLAADSPISTFSLFEAIDYCVTVRGTVGLEASCFGVPVLTAGTGRYDRLGFTIDHDSREDFLESLARLEEVPPPTEAETELARRYAYGVIMARPLPLRSTEFVYDHDASASLSAKLVLDPSGDIAAAPDVAAIAAWIEGGAEDVLSETPAVAPDFIAPKSLAV